MGKISLQGVCDMHVHTNPDLRLRAYDDFELADAAVRVGAKAIVIKSHLGFTVNRAYLTNQYVKRVYGENTGFTMYGGVVSDARLGSLRVLKQSTCMTRESRLSKRYFWSLWRVVNSGATVKEELQALRVTV